MEFRENDRLLSIILPCCTTQSGLESSRWKLSFGSVIKEKRVRCVRLFKLTGAWPLNVVVRSIAPNRFVDNLM